MKKLFALAAAALILSACSSTWSGAKDDTNRNWDKTKETAERVADKTKETAERVADKTEEAVKKRRQCSRPRHEPCWRKNRSRYRIIR